MKKALLAAVLIIGTLASGCTRVETGHAGVRVTFGGDIEPQERGTGWHQTLVGSMRIYTANEMTLELPNLHPQTKDRTNLEDLDLAYNYSITPGKIAELVVKYKGRDLHLPNGDIYPLGAYVNNVVTTATGDVFARYDALEANNNRDKIRQEIKDQASAIFKEDGIAGDIRIHQVFIKSLQIDKKLQQSAINVVAEQNNLKAKQFEVETARKEAERLGLLANNSKNIDYMNAKSMSDIAEGVKAGKVHTIIIPHDFRGLIQHVK